MVALASSPSRLPFCSCHAERSNSPRAVGALGLRGLNFFEPFLMRKFHDTSLTRNSASASSAFLCQDVCHVLRDHDKHEEFIGPRFFVDSAALEMHPLDTDDRIADMKHKANIGYCNITKCCTKVCPEHIQITDNAIIPLKERVVDRFYDPVTRLLRMVTG